VTEDTTLSHARENFWKAVSCIRSVTKFNVILG